MPGTSVQRNCAEVAHLRLASAARPDIPGRVDALVRRSPPHAPDGCGTGAPKMQGTANKGFPSRLPPVHPLFISRPGGVSRPDDAFRLGGMGQPAP